MGRQVPTWLGHTCSSGSEQEGLLLPEGPMGAGPAPDAVAPPAEDEVPDPCERLV